MTLAGRSRQATDDTSNRAKYCQASVEELEVNTMSVILFSKAEVFQDLANAYERLKSRLIFHNAEEDYKFYKSLRRLYFANVATYLCQYHDDTPLNDNELQAIETFSEIQGKANPLLSEVEALHIFLSAWGSLRYNLVTNDGERYEAKEAYECITSLALTFSRSIIETLALSEQKK